jgi:hypothetical protein
LPGELLTSLLKSLVYGTEKSFIEIRQASFEAITAIGQNCMKEQMTSGEHPDSPLTLSFLFTFILNGYLVV